MEATERIHELDKIYTQFQQFIIAVNGALIAYAFKQVDNKVLTLELIPLVIAIIFWGLSFYYGISSIRKLISTRILEIFKSTNNIIRQDAQKAEIVKIEIHKVGDKANSYNVRMFTFLYLGGCSYLLWQIIGMYLRTKA